MSCHLYPVRVQEYSEFAAVNYHHWEICDDACTLGKELQVPVYKFVKEALIRKFGKIGLWNLKKLPIRLNRPLKNYLFRKNFIPTSSNCIQNRIKKPLSEISCFLKNFRLKSVFL